MSETTYFKLLELIASKMRCGGKKISISLDLKYDELKELSEIIKSKQPGHYKITYENKRDTIYNIYGEEIVNKVNIMTIEWDIIGTTHCSDLHGEMGTWIYEIARL